MPGRVPDRCAVRQDSRARAGLAAAYGQWEGALRDGLRAMQDRGEPAEDADPGYLALALLTALQGGLVMNQARRDTIALETVLNAVIERVRCHAPACPSPPSEESSSSRVLRLRSPPLRFHAPRGALPLGPPAFPDPCAARRSPPNRPMTCLVPRTPGTRALGGAG
jgi:hypothetical protein